MNYEYVGILCGADDSILDLKYDGIEFEKETLTKEKMIEKYSVIPDNLDMSGVYIRKKNKYEIIKAKIIVSGKELDFINVEQNIHEKIDFFIKSMNMLTDGYLYVIYPIISDSKNKEKMVFTYEFPSYDFQKNSQTKRENRYLKKYKHQYLIEKMNIIKNNNILTTVKEVYNQYKLANNRDVEIILLTTCLEIFLIKKNENITEKISMRVATLFSYKGNYKDVYKMMQLLYALRSNIIHTGEHHKMNEYGKEFISFYMKNDPPILKLGKFKFRHEKIEPPVAVLREIVRSLIILFIINNVNKDDILIEIENLVVKHKIKFMENDYPKEPLIF